MVRGRQPGDGLKKEKWAERTARAGVGRRRRGWCAGLVKVESQRGQKPDKEGGARSGAEREEGFGIFCK